jgi:hypothetical protein
MTRNHLRTWLFLAMGLAGLLAVALIVTSDESYAGIDGKRAIPVVTGLMAAIQDLTPAFLDPPAPPSPIGAPVDPPPAVLPPSIKPSPKPSPRPASSPSAPVAATAAPVPAAQSAAATKAPPASAPAPAPAPSGSPTDSPADSPAPSPTPTPDPSATPSPSPSATPSPSPSPIHGPTIAVATDRGATAAVDLADLVPGDSIDRTITVQNTGSLAFRYTVSATQTASTPLWTDLTDGLRLIVRTAGGTVLYAGPLSQTGFVPGVTTLAPGTSETLRYTFDFPASASNAFQGLHQDLTLVFDAVEFP